MDAIIRQYKDAHYRRVLDEPVPMLGGKTPRQCARTRAGRARLVRWLKDLENGELHAAVATGEGAHAFAWLWGGARRSARVKILPEALKGTNSYIVNP